MLLEVIEEMATYEKSSKNGDPRKVIEKWRPTKGHRIMGNFEDFYSFIENSALQFPKKINSMGNLVDVGASLPRKYLFLQDRWSFQSAS
jgi:hypothetical protein